MIVFTIRCICKGESGVYTGSLFITGIDGDKMKSDISKYYESCGSLKQTGKAFSISPQKVRKILITEGSYETDMSRSVCEMYHKGYSIEDISLKLKITKTCVNSYLPYRKGMYKTPHPSKNAKNIRKWREKSFNRMELQNKNEQS